LILLPVMNKIHLKYKYFNFLLPFLLMTQCSDTGNVLRIGTNVWPGYEPLYVAQSEGRWDKNRIKLVEYPSSSEVMRAFRNKAIEGASLTLDEVLMLKQDNISVKVVLIHDISDGGDVIIAKKNIKSVKDLRGKTIAVESNALGAFVLTRALEINGLKVKDVKILTSDVNEHENTFISGKADAVVTFEPVRTKLLKTGAVEIFSSKEIKNEIIDVLVFHEEALDKNKETVRILIDGWFWAVDLLNSSPKKTAQIISKRLKISPEEVLNSYQGLHIPDRKENLKLLHGENSEISRSLLKLNRILLENNLINSKYDVSDLITSEYISNN